VVGVSAGGLEALHLLIPSLPSDFPCPVLIVQHRASDSDDYLARSLNQSSAVTVKEAEEKERVREGVVYLAPADYHLLIERDGTLSLSVAPAVNFSRPSIDVLFESAAMAWADRLIGIVLTGANHDGAHGLEIIRRRGGTVIVQDPEDAEHDTMPRAALEAVAADHVPRLRDVAPLLSTLTCTGSDSAISPPPPPARIQP
jgi:two-component system chemotaxis response regulator CheB